MEQTKPKFSVEKVTMFVSVAGLFMSLILSELNRRANIELEEKKIEASLFLQAIQVNNKQGTLDNLKFLLKMGAISEERQKAIQSLSDSIYLDAANQIFTNSDTVGFFDFQVSNNKKDAPLIDQFIRGANIQITSTDTSKRFTLSQYTDNYGFAEFYFPKAYENVFTRITIMKKGYKSKTFEMKLPNENSSKYRENIILEKQ